MVKNLLRLGLVLALLSSCGSLRKAVPMAQEEGKDYPVTGRQETPPEKAASVPLESTPETVPATPQEAPDTPQAAPKLSEQVIAYARTFTGTPYKLGASGPRQFDCSSFTSYVFRHFGYEITPYSVKQFAEGREVASYSDLQPGDLVFFGKRAGVRSIGHVGIVVSVNQENGSFDFIHASVSKGVTEENSNHPYFMMRYMGARRILPDE